MAHEYIDHLTEHIKTLAVRFVRDHRDSLPQELIGLPDDRIVYLITDMATPILRKIEDDAIAAAIERVTSLIRYSKMTGEPSGIIRQSEGVIGWLYDKGKQQRRVTK